MLPGHPCLAALAKTNVNKLLRCNQASSFENATSFIRQGEKAENSFIDCWSYDTDYEKHIAGNMEDSKKKMRSEGFDNVR